MKINSFHAGLYLTLNDVAYRIERIYESGDCLLERITDHAMVQRSKGELIKLFEEGMLSFEGNEANKIREKNRNPIDVASLSKDQQKTIFRKKEYIIGAEKMLGKKPTNINIEIAINEVSELLNDKNIPSVSSVLRWWKSWVNSGNNILCLINKKPGLFKKRRFENSSKIITEVIEEHYLTNQRTSVQDVYDQLCFRFSEINKARLFPLKILSRGSFYRMI